MTLHDGDNVIGHVTYTYNGRIVGSTDILYTKSADSTTSHLDEATRKIVDSKIQDIKESEKKDQKNANFLRKIKKGLMSFFGNRIVQIVFLVILIGIIIAILVCILKKVELPRFGRRGRGRVSGGYRSRGGRRQHARRQRSMRSSERKTGKGQYLIISCYRILTFSTSPGGFEPLTPRLGGECSIQLSYEDRL